MSDEHLSTHGATPAEHSPGRQPEFVGTLALVLLVLAVLFALFVLYAGLSHPAYTY